MNSLSRRLHLPPMSRDVWLVATATACLAASFMGMQQLLKAIYVLRLGYGPAFVGLYFATGALSFSFSSIPAGMLGGRLGPRRMMMAGALTMLTGAALLPLAGNIPPGTRAVWLIGAQIIGACGWATFNVNQTTALMAFTTDENRKFSYSFRESMAGFGTFVGAMVGGMLPAFFAWTFGTTTASPIPYRDALIATVFVGLLGVVPLARVAPVARPARMPSRRAALPPLLPFAVFLACGFLSHSAMASSRIFFPPYFDQDFGLPTALIGLITSTGTALAVGAALASAPFSRRYGSPAMMMAASLGLSASLLIMALSPGWAGAAVGVIGTLALVSVWLPNYQMRLMEMAAPGQRALVAGIGSTAMSLGFASMSFNGGRIAAVAGYNRLFLLGAGLAAASVGLLWLSQRVPLRPPADEPLPVVVPEHHAS